MAKAETTITQKWIRDGVSGTLTGPENAGTGYMEQCLQTALDIYRGKTPESRKWAYTLNVGTCTIQFDASNQTIDAKTTTTLLPLQGLDVKTDAWLAKQHTVTAQWLDEQKKHLNDCLDDDVDDCSRPDYFAEYDANDDALTIAYAGR